MRKKIFAIPIIVLFSFITVIFVCFYAVNWESSDVGSMKSSRKHQNAINTFKQSNFRCRTECVCVTEGKDDTSERRTSSTFPTFSTVISATSAILAVNYASKHFSGACEKQFSHACEATAGKIDLDGIDCTELNEVLDDYQDEFPTNYACSGRCGTYEERYEEMKELGGEVELGSFEEKMIRTEKEIRKKYVNFAEEVLHCSEYKNEKFFFAADSIEALKMMRDSLDSFCREMAFVGDINHGFEGLEQMCVPTLKSIECKNLL